jgi:hypothetical protein
VGISVNTIAGGFVGGVESGAARKRYVRRLDFETKFIEQTSVAPVPDISFTKEDKQEVMPHDDDPLVIQVQILNCDVKRVLIDSGSSADIMYYEAFKAMQLTNEHLMPYTTVLWQVLQANNLKSWVTPCCSQLSAKMTTQKQLRSGIW